MSSVIINSLGRISVADQVVAEIAGQIATNCFGVIGMVSHSATRDSIATLLGKENLSRGVSVVSEGDSVEISLSIIVRYGVPIPTVCDAIIDNVKYQVENTIGLRVKNVHVVVQDIRV